jgi:L-fuconolactonase
VTASVVVQTVTVAAETPELLALAAASDLVITAGQLGQAARAAAAVPDLRFVLDHLGKPTVASGRTEPWAADLRGLAALPNTSAKLSGLVTEADWHHWKVADLRPYTEIALDAFGPARLMFGSDWPVSTLAATYFDVLAAARDLTAALSPAEREAVFSGTATAAYGL